MYAYAETGRQISRADLLKALTRLGDLLHQRNKKLELTCCGGIVSLMYFYSRNMTQDIDAIFPENPINKIILIDLIKQVGEEMGWSIDGKSLWFNDSVSFFGLETSSDVVIFKHHSKSLVLKAASWGEMLAHKIHASRHDKDIDDALHLLKEMRGEKKENIYAAVKKHAPFVPHVPEKLLKERFEKLWNQLHGV